MEEEEISNDLVEWEYGPAPVIEEEVEIEEEEELESE